MADSKELKENASEQEEKGIAMEILGELKTQNKRLSTILIIVICLWFATISGFVWYMSQYDYTSYTVDSNDGGNANYIGNDGDIINGEGEGGQTNKEERKIQGDGN